MPRRIITETAWTLGHRVAPCTLLPRSAAGEVVASGSNWRDIAIAGHHVSSTGGHSEWDATARKRAVSINEVIKRARTPYALKAGGVRWAHAAQQQCRKECDGE